VPLSTFPIGGKPPTLATAQLTASGSRRIITTEEEEEEQIFREEKQHFKPHPQQMFERPKPVRK
jgi:hypothetical protein